MKKIVIGVSIAVAVIVIIVVSLSVGNMGTSPAISSPTVTPTSNATLPTITSHRHFDLSLDERMKFKT